MTDFVADFVTNFVINFVTCLWQVLRLFCECFGTNWWPILEAFWDKFSDRFCDRFCDNYFWGFVTVFVTYYVTFFVTYFVKILLEVLGQIQNIVQMFDPFWDRNPHSFRKISLRFNLLMAKPPRKIISEQNLDFCRSFFFNFSFAIWFLGLTWRVTLL